MSSPCLHTDVILVGVEHLGVIVRVELHGKHVGDARIAQALMPQGWQSCRENMQMKIWEEQR